MQTRRQFIGRGAAIAAAAAVGPTVFTRRAGAAGRLSILQWSHFVPAYDRWFDPWARRWGIAHSVEVAVDHVSFADVVPRATAEVAAQSGHDLHMFLGLAGAFEEHAVDLSDVARTLEKQYGPPVDLARRSTYNPFSRKQFALSDMWVPDPGDYLKTVWTTIGRVDGPRTWEDLVASGPEIRRKFPNIQIPVGIGLSQDIDSNMAVRDILWSYGGSVQDEQGNVVLNTPETLDALDYARRLYRGAMTPAVLSWNAASNNQALNARATSYILNSISAYRTAQANKLPIADDIFFTPALQGPGRHRLASEHVMSSYVLWKFSQNQDIAKQFLADLVGASRDAVQASELYNFPSYYGAVADAAVPVRERSGAGQAWLNALTRHDPYGSTPANKLAVLTTALDWSTNLGHPGHANPAVGEVFDTYVLTDMFAKAATAALSPKDALAEANTRVREIFTRWRRKDLVGGGSKDL